MARQKVLWMEWQKVFPESNTLLISSLASYPNIRNLPNLQTNSVLQLEEPFSRTRLTYPELHHLLLFFCFHHCIFLFKFLHTLRVELHTVGQQHKPIRIRFSTWGKIFLEELQCRISCLYGFYHDTNGPVIYMYLSESVPSTCLPCQGRGDLPSPV